MCVCMSTVFAGECSSYAQTASLKIYAWIHSIRVLPRVKEDERGQIRSFERLNVSFKA